MNKTGKIKIHILFAFHDRPWGGGNQFLKALRKYFQQISCYEEDPYRADVILFISYPFNSEGFFLRVRQMKKEKSTVVVNRMNGPISLYRGRDIEVDRINFKFNNDAADGTIYQSEWSRSRCYDLGMKKNSYEAVIRNAPDPEIFFPDKGSRTLSEDGRVRLISVSWSSNMKKGFDVYKYLDEHLDLSRYDMTFIGNAPFEFRNIKHIAPLPSEKLAETLRGHDIFVFASMLETCSNSLLEAIHCGLPVVARNNSSQPEIVGRGGILFEGVEDVLPAIDTVAQNIDSYRSLLKASDISEAGGLYYDFCREVYEDIAEGRSSLKKWNIYDHLRLLMDVFWWKYCIGTKERFKSRFRSRKA